MIVELDVCMVSGRRLFVAAEDIVDGACRVHKTTDRCGVFGHSLLRVVGRVNDCQHLLCFCTMPWRAQKVLFVVLLADNINVVMSSRVLYQCTRSPAGTGTLTKQPHVLC